jgi:hypothetical protein
MIPLRPLRIGEILDSAFRLYRATFVEVAILVAISLGVFQALATLVQGPQPSLLDPAALEATDPNRMLARLLLSGGITLVAQLFVHPLVQGGVTGIALERDRGGDHSWQAGLRLGLRLAGRLLGLAFLLLGLGILAIAVLGVVVAGPIVLLLQGDAPVLAVLWGVATGLATLAGSLVVAALVRLAVPVVVVEDVGPWSALRRSVALVRPQVLRIIGIVLLTGLLFLVIGAVLGVGNAALAVVGGPIGVVGAIVLATVSLVITVPLEANIALLLYVDARVRREGLDVAVLTAELGRA